MKLPAKLRVGYIMGTGDEIPAVLRSVGVNLNIITPQELASGDLGNYDTIVVGIRAYDVRTDVREQNRRLLEYVNNSGTLIVQYNQSTSVFNEGHYTPYPATLSNARVSVEEQPVEILAPEERVFSYPNKITANDFDGWVQERGLYFMSSGTRTSSRCWPAMIPASHHKKAAASGPLRQGHLYLFGIRILSSASGGCAWSGAPDGEPAECGTLITFRSKMSWTQ